MCRKRCTGRVQSSSDREIAGEVAGRDKPWTALWAPDFALNYLLFLVLRSEESTVGYFFPTRAHDKAVRSRSMISECEFGQIGGARPRREIVRDVDPGENFTASSKDNADLFFPSGCVEGSLFLPSEWSVESGRGGSSSGSVTSASASGDAHGTRFGSWNTLMPPSLPCYLVVASFPSFLR